MLLRELHEGLIDRRVFQVQPKPLVAELQALLERGSGCPDSKTATFCAILPNLYPALWLLAEIEGIKPTNNHAERVHRIGVFWRKKAFGYQSDSACRFVERILTLMQTLRLQKRTVLDFLVESVITHIMGIVGSALIMPMLD